MVDSRARTEFFLCSYDSLAPEDGGGESLAGRPVSVADAARRFVREARRGGEFFPSLQAGYYAR